MTITVTITNPTTRDQLAAVYIIDQENARRAALTPPGTPLPKANSTQIKASYEAVLSALVSSAHDSYLHQEAQANGPDSAAFKAAFLNATASQRTAALTALTT